MQSWVLKSKISRPIYNTTLTSTLKLAFFSTTSPAVGQLLEGEVKSRPLPSDGGKCHFNLQRTGQTSEFDFRNSHQEIDPIPLNLHEIRDRDCQLNETQGQSRIAMAWWGLRRQLPIHGAERQSFAICTQRKILAPGGIPSTHPPRKGREKQTKCVLMRLLSVRSPNK